MNRTMPLRMLGAACRVVLLALATGLGIFAMGVLADPQATRLTTLDLLARLAAIGSGRG